jgi:hypothetical protein
MDAQISIRYSNLKWVLFISIPAIFLLKLYKVSISHCQLALSTTDLQRQLITREWPVEVKRNLKILSRV